MPSRHNAVVSIKFNEHKPPQFVYLSGYGRPDDIREFTRRAFRSQRRVITGEPDIFFFNFVREVGFRTAMHLESSGGRYSWSYKFDLAAEVPTVTIHSHITDSKARKLLFSWIGPERRNYKEPKAVQPMNNSPGGKLRKRGRPTTLSSYAVPAPDWALDKNK